METVVEIGSDEQKALIHEELSIIKSVCKHFDQLPPIDLIFVPENFDDKVNELQRTMNYISERKHVAVAKNIWKDGRVCLVFSKLLFTSEHDTVTRLQIYIHEVVHVINSLRFPSYDKETPAKSCYLHYMYILFDEYDANRKSYKAVENMFPNTSKRYTLNNRIYLKRHIKAALNEKTYMSVQKMINRFRVHGVVDKFLNNVQPYFDEVATSIVYAYSYIHQDNKLERLDSLISQSKFVNTRTKNLIECFREKFESSDCQFIEEYEFMADFMKNFGMEFSDTPQGIYCSVLDI